MTRALAGHQDVSFEVPSGILVTSIRDTGKLAVPGCPRVFTESFFASTPPTESCDLHRF